MVCTVLNCFVFNHIQEPTQDSLILSVLLYNVIFEYCTLYGALVVTSWTCYGALQIVVLLLLLLLLLLFVGQVFGTEEDLVSGDKEADDREL